VIELHSSTIFNAAFAGFAPGFMYCTGLPEVLHLPRRATPRTSVPAGSLAMADAYTAIYPLNSPGGWNLIGTTNIKMFDAKADQPSFLLPGDRVRFVPVPK
jgi:KipI family sensor histidine kinase inhibitor